MPDEKRPEERAGKHAREAFASRVRSYDVSLPVRLSTTERGQARLLDILAGGEPEVIVAAVDGSLSVRATLARTDRLEFTYGNLSIDWSRGSVASAVGSVTLSRTELRLLGALLEQKGAAVDYAHLMRCACPDATVEPQNSKVLKAYVHSLRQRLAVIGAGSALVSVRGVGYRFKA
jgi:DNA-binding response OmpR family regulator